MPDRLNLAGRVGVVTGASRGIGAVIAETLAANGMNLLLTANANSERLVKRAQVVAAEYGVQIQTHEGDVADPATSVALAKLAFSTAVATVSSEILPGSVAGV